jgi:hypothetical protein
MIVDHRTYELQPGPVHGLPVQMKHLRHHVGYLTAEVGNVNEIVHIRDLADRAKRRPPWLRILGGIPTCRRAENS